MNYNKGGIKVFLVNSGKLFRLTTSEKWWIFIMWWISI